MLFISLLLIEKGGSLRPVIRDSGAKLLFRRQYVKIGTLKTLVLYST